MISARFAVVLLSSALAFAQSDLFDKAPPDVDEALRARINIYYNAQVSGKFSEALKVVSPDSLDEFMAAPKEMYKGCELKKISYSDDYTKATATTACKGEMTWHGRHVPVTMPLLSTWKVVDGKWCWYHIRETSVDTPFGTLSITPDKPGSLGAGAIPADPTAMAADILKSVQIDRSEVQLNGWELSKTDVHVSNKMPGSVTLSVDRIALAGLNAKVDKPTLGQGETATITFYYDPKDPAIQCGSCTVHVVFPTQTAMVRVSPTAQTFPVTITFAVPEEMKKLLPKQSKN